MVRFEAAWLPGGAVELVRIPLKGDKELKTLAKADADVEAIFTQFKFIALAKALLAAERVLKTFSKDDAKRLWDEFLVAEMGGIPEFIWPETTFAEDLASTKTAVINKQMACKDDDDAEKKLDEMSRATAEAAKKMDKGAVERITQRPLIALWWRLRASGVKQVITPEGPKDLDWKLTSREECMDVIAEVVTQDELKALDARPKNRPLDMKEFKPLSRADVEGKSRTPSEPLTASKPDSPLSSEATTETATA